MRTPLAVTLASLPLLWVLAFGARLDAHDPAPNSVTWVGDIARIFAEHCVQCHRAGRGNPMPLTTYEDVQPWVGAIRRQVLTRSMPIWHAARGFGEFANDPSLSSADVAAIVSWANAGGPRGTESGGRSTTTADIVPHARASSPNRKDLREITVPCGTQTVSGRLLGVRPALTAGQSVVIRALLADGQHAVVAWIRDYDPRYPTTYWLRTPLTLTRGSRVEVDDVPGCRLTLTMERR